MLLKRHIPLLIVVVVGLLTLFGHFINNHSVNNFVKNIATEWFDIIASLAIFLGALNMMQLHVYKILAFQQNRYPYLMIDIAENVVPGKSAIGYKNLTSNDWFFRCHFPGDPNMPGLLQIEAIVQIAALTILTLPGNNIKIIISTLIL